MRATHVIAAMMGVIAAALVAVLMSAGFASSVPPPQAVIEQNTDTSGNIKVHEQGTANVNVMNGNLAVRVVGEEPMQLPLDFRFIGGTQSAVNYTVPAGKRLRIDFVTLHDLNRIVDVEDFSVHVTQGGQFTRHWLSTSRQGANGDVTSEQVEIYADPGTSVGFLVRLSGPLGGGEVPEEFVHGSFSGVLTDA
jgi:hypothetical protein